MLHIVCEETKPASVIHTNGKKVRDTGDGTASTHDTKWLLLAFYLVKKEDTEENEEEEAQRSEEKTRETKTSFKPAIQDKEQINITESAQRTSWLAMAKSNPRRSRRRGGTKRGKERADKCKAGGDLNPKTGFEIPNLKLGPERPGSEPNHPPSDDGCKLKPEPSFLGFIGMVTKGTRV